MTFEELKLRKETQKAIKELGFEKPTPIQENSIPKIREGKDLVGRSLTGSGKTAAFGLPILERIEKGKGIQSVILAPTRELAEQVKKELEKLAKYLGVKITSVYGGVGIEPQIKALKESEIVVATPGRFLDHVNRGTIELGNVGYFIIDEADKMLEMGFIEDVEKIMKNLPDKRQTLLFSATIPPEVNKLVKKYLNNPVEVKEQEHVDSSLLKEVYYDVRQHEKFSILVHLLKNETPGLALVFCATRRESDIVAKNLKKNGLKATAVHGGLTQNKRDKAVADLKKEDIDILVATDVAARGLDINNVTHVYNYDVPENAKEYTHRIGRTARAGREGDAVTLLTDRDHENFGRIHRERNIEKAEKPQFSKVPFERNQGDDRGRGSKGRNQKGRDRNKNNRDRKKPNRNNYRK